MMTLMEVKGQRIITLDGPAASGKSSVARLVAGALGVPYLSSGLLYRAATLLAQRHGQDLGDEVGLLRLLEGHRVRLEVSPNAANRVFIESEEVSSALHTDAVDAGVSAVARHPKVRLWVDERLREVEGPFVVEGRDMGTEVFPGAAHKFYLSAPTEVRAARRVGERGANLGSVAEALKRRDALDAAQLRPAENAVHIDTAGMTLDEVVACVLSRLSAT